MSLAVDCSTCGRSFKAPDTAAGRRAKCPQCGATLTIPAAGGPATSPQRPGSTAGPEPPPALAQVVHPPVPIAHPPSGGAVAPSGHPGRGEEDYKECPFCGEDVRVWARKCKHCGETLDVALRAAEEAKRESRRDRRPVSVRQETYVDVHRPGFNHGVHIILDIFTCGAWLPIHLICWACHR